MMNTHWVNKGMRNWITIIESLSEAPIEDMGVLGSQEEPGSMRGPDLRAITNPKWQLKLRERMARTPYPINIYFLNAPSGRHEYLDNSHGREFTQRLNITNTGPKVNGNDDEPRLDTAVKFLQEHAGIYSPEDFQKIFGFIPPNHEGSVSVLLSQNEGDGRVPFTQWIVAHRIIHAFDLGSRQRAKAYAEEYPHGLWGAAGQWMFHWSDFYKQARTIIQKQTGATADYNDVGREFGTTQSQREGRLINSGEFYTEMGAQYLLTGRVRLKQPSFDLTDFQFDVQQWAETFTEDFHRLLENCVGKIFVF